MVRPIHAQEPIPSLPSKCSWTLHTIVTVIASWLGDIPACWHWCTTRPAPPYSFCIPFCSTIGLQDTSLQWPIILVARGVKYHPDEHLWSWCGVQGVWLVAMSTKRPERPSPCHLAQPVTACLTCATFQLLWPSACWDCVALVFLPSLACWVAGQPGLPHPPDRCQCVFYYR